MRRLRFLVACCGLVAACSYELRQLDATLPTSAQSSVIYAADGTAIVTLHAEENRTDLTLAEIPVHVRDAVIAIEDERFWLHNGVDLRAILRAVSVNAREGGVTQGGSTITQQLVKQLLLGTEQTLDRKVQEAALAWQLEDRYTKERILELYLNTIYLGNGAYGLSAASHEYFDKSPAELTVAEGALLAGLIQAPTTNNPFRNPDRALARRALVLEAMVDQGLLDEAAFDAATAEPLTLAGEVPVLEERYRAGHFVEEVKQWILDDPIFGQTDRARRELLFAGGIRVHTTIDLRLQRAAEEAVAAVLPDPGGPEAALVAIQPQTGHVLAMVGGRDYFGASDQAKFNLAMGRGRHTGSAFKPIVLAAALQDGIPLTEQFAAPGSMQLHCPNDVTWDVDNYGEGGPGVPVDLTEATVRSYNTVYAQLILRVGLARAIEVAHDLGITRPLETVCSAVLGANDVQPLEMASVYATLANRGVHVAPVFVTSVARADGTILYEAPHRQRRAVDPWVADTVTSVLHQAVERGTGTAARIDGRPVAGKTGTAQAWRNAWFCGYTPQLAAAVWVGFPGRVQYEMTPPRTAIRVTGGSYPAQIWQRFMAEASTALDVMPFPEPSSTTTTVPAGALPTTPTTGPPQILPDVLGAPGDDAAAVLRALGFRVSLVEGRSGPEPGTVVAMSPRPGATLGGGGVVTLELATAVTTTTTAAPGSVAIPEVVGLRDRDAVAALEDAGLVADVREVEDPAGGTRPGRVWAQEPQAGTRVPPGSTVRLAVQP